jgi:hypothetical protein
MAITCFTAATWSRTMSATRAARSKVRSTLVPALSRILASRAMYSAMRSRRKGG